MLSTVLATTLALLWTGAILSCSTLDDVMTAIIRGAMLDYGMDCALLLHSRPTFFHDGELAKQSMLVKRMRLLSAAGVPTASMDVQTTSVQQVATKCHEKSQLIVLFDADQDTRQFLKGAVSSLPATGVSWLAVLDAHQDPRQLLSGVHLPFGSSFLLARTSSSSPGAYHLAEAYRVFDGGELHITHYCVWSAARGPGVAVPDVPSKYRRRPSLHGLTITAAYTPKEFVITEIEEGHGRKKKVGIFADVWNMLEEILNFTTEYRKNEYGGYGIQRDGSWNGMVEMLRRNEVDVAIGDFTMSNNRLTVIDFIIPLFTTSFSVYIRAPMNHEVNWRSFAAPFSGGLWGCALGSVPLVAAITWALQLFGARDGELPLQRRQRQHRRVGFSTALLSVVRTLCQQGHDDTPRTWSCRAIFLTLYFTSQVLYAAYSAALVSSLAKKELRLPFDDMSGLLRDGTYRFYVARMSAEYEMFKVSNDSQMRAIFRRYLKDDSILLKEDVNSLLTLCRDNNAAVLQTKVLVTANSGKTPCRVVSLPTTVFQTSMAIAVVKCSPYQHVINYYVRKLAETGLIPRIKVRYQSPPASEAADGQDEVVNWSEVDLAHVAPMLAMLCSGAAAAVVVLLLEMLLHRLHFPTALSAASHSHPAAGDYAD